MKGTNTFYLNDDQMNYIVQQWWDGLAYKADGKANVSSVKKHTSGNFEVTLDEIPKGLGEEE